MDTKEFQIQFGKAIRMARLQKGLNQFQMAELVGVTQSYLSYIESGERDLSFLLAVQICSRLGLNVQEIIDQYAIINQ